MLLHIPYSGLTEALSDDRVSKQLYTNIPRYTISSFQHFGKCHIVCVSERVNQSENKLSYCTTFLEPFFLSWKFGML